MKFETYIYIWILVLVIWSIIPKREKKTKTGTPLSFGRPTFEGLTKDEIIELKEYRKRHIGLSEKDLEYIESLKDKNAYIKDILENKRTELAKETHKLAEQIRRVKILDKDPQNVEMAKRKILEDLRLQFKNTLSSATYEAQIFYNEELHRAKQLQKQGAPLTMAELEKVQRLQSRKLKIEKEKQDYSDFLKKATRKNLSMYLNRS